MDNINQLDYPHYELAPKNNSLRIIGAILCGIIAGILLISAIDRGAYLYFVEKEKEWNSFTWDNWFIRTLASIIASSWGAFIAGLISRTKGKLVGVISAFPSFAFWLLYFFGQLNGEINIGVGIIEIETDTVSKIMAIVLALTNIIIGYIAGGFGNEISNEHIKDFDERKHSILGVKWYHYIWSPFIIYFILIQGFFVSFYVLEKIYFLFQLPEYSLSGIIPNILASLASISIYVSYKALTNSYKILSGNEYSQTNGEKVKKLAGYLIGFPVLSLAIQLGTYYLELGVYNLLN